MTLTSPSVNMTIWTDEIITSLRPIAEAKGMTIDGLIRSVVDDCIKGVVSLGTTPTISPQNTDEHSG